MEGGDERREDNTAAGEEETNLGLNTEVSYCLITIKDNRTLIFTQDSPSRTGDVVINVGSE